MPREFVNLFISILVIICPTFNIKKFYFMLNERENVLLARHQSRAITKSSFKATD
jgi:hypothetical protein